MQIWSLCPNLMYPALILLFFLFVINYSSICFWNNIAHCHFVDAMINGSQPSYAWIALQARCCMQLPIIVAYRRCASAVLQSGRFLMVDCILVSLLRLID